MGKPIITVIIPVFNEEKYIDRCMESVHTQTYQNLQVILVDGGSTDLSPVKCDEWAKKWNLGSKTGIVEVIHTDNNGVSASRNLGLAHATGEYVTFIDGDDWLDPRAIEMMYNAICSEESDVAGMDFESRYDTEPAYEEEQGNEIISLSSCDFIATKFLKGDVHCWGRLYRRDIIGQQRFKKGLTIGEDMLFLLEYLLKCEKVSCLSYQGYKYYRNPNGVMTRPFKPSTMDQLVCWQDAGHLLGIYGDKEECSEEFEAFKPALQANILISVMLIAGRLAFLEKNERKEYTKPARMPYGNTLNTLKQEISLCKNRQSMKLLDRGYRLKVRLFKAVPGLYLWIYHFHK